MGIEWVHCLFEADTPSVATLVGGAIVFAAVLAHLLHSGRGTAVAAEI